MPDFSYEQILDRYKRPQFSGSATAATHAADGVNQSCGDEARIEMRIQDDIIHEIRHTCRACAICTASADLLCEELSGQPLASLAEWNTERITGMLGIALSPIRLKCALLPLETAKLATGTGNSLRTNLG